jgi:hypothetical protein
MYLFDILVNNPMFMSGAFILNMFGGRMMFQDMQPYIQNQNLLKYVFIFCLFLIATKDINLSIVLIIIYIIFMQIIKDLYPIKKEDNKIEDKAKYIDSCIENLNNLKKTL